MSARFAGARLSDASFDDTVLRKADLRGVTGDRVCFQRSDLTRADMSDAVLRDADLLDATLRGVISQRAIID